MLRIVFSTVLTFTIVQIAAGGTIELWDGTKATGITIGKVEDGYLHYKSKSGARRIQLTKIKSVIASDEGTARIVRFVDYKGKSRSGKLLSISIASEKARIVRPLVRVLMCCKDKRDELELYSYQNSRIYDPTNCGKLDEVESADFKERHYEISRSDGVAFRVEIWQEGRLSAFENYGNEDQALPADWFRKMPLKSTRTMKVLTEIGKDKTIEDLVTGDETAPTERGWKVSSISALPEPLTSQPRVKVSYQFVNLAENTALSPKVIVHYVTKSSEGELEISNMTISSGGKKLMGSKGVFRGSVEKKMPGTLRLTSLEAQNTKGAKQLVHWRVELLREDGVLATLEKQGSMKKKLPAGWWK
jgi:hypothetical protein